jgi:hypothetical protein
MKLILLILLSLSLNSLFAQPVDKTYSTKSDRKNFFSTLSKNYSPADVQKIWKSDEIEEEFDQWVDGRKESEIIDEYSTCIHELFHGNCKMIRDGQNYYINKDISIYVPYTETYKSTELNKVVRKGVQDSIFRYCLYVGGKNELPDGSKTDLFNTSENNQPSSIQIGIYGMLEEFSAYYYGTYTNYHLENYFIDKFGKDNADARDDYSQMVLGDAMAYYEFRLFMGWYLVHAKAKYPDVYNGIQNNKALKVVYTLMTDKFTKLVNDIEVKFANELVYDASLFEMELDETLQDYLSLDLTGSDEDLIRYFELEEMQDDEVYTKTTKTINGKNVTAITIVDAEEFQEYKYEYQLMVVELQLAKKEVNDFKNQMNSYGILVFMALPSLEFPYLKKQFTNEMNEELKKLRMEGVTESNYKDFLK